MYSLVVEASIRINNHLPYGVEIGFAVSCDCPATSLHANDNRSSFSQQQADLSPIVIPRNHHVYLPMFSAEERLNITVTVSLFLISVAFSVANILKCFEKRECASRFLTFATSIFRKILLKTKILEARLKVLLIFHDRPIVSYTLPNQVQKNVGYPNTSVY